MDKANASDLGALLENIRSMNADQLQETFEKTIPWSRILSEYFDQLNEKDWLTAHHACLLEWFVAGGSQVPQDILELQSCLATFNGKDSLVYVGTAGDKMLPSLSTSYLSTRPRNTLQSRFIHWSGIRLPRSSPTALLFSFWLRSFIQASDFNMKYGVP